ncbi:MAG: hypothetical protein PVF73_10135 [Bacteroidales bacterium]|jgi:murein L,D-transpeptidase YcbB/YkuD
MRTSTKHKSEKPAPLSKVFILSIFLVSLNFPFNNGKCDKHVFSENVMYSSLTKELIRTSLQDCQNKVVWLEGIELLSAPLICDFYKLNNFSPAWTVGSELSESAEVILGLLKDSYKYGFEPDNFDISSLERYARQLSKEKHAKKSAKIRARFEFLMTNSVFSFMLNITEGTEYSNMRNVFVNGDSIIAGFPGYLISILSSENIREDILMLQPDDEEYLTLQQEMEMIVSSIVTSENTVKIPDRDQDPEGFFKLFSYVFRTSGISDAGISLSDSEEFSALLVNYQYASGIRETGKIDKATYRAVVSTIKSRYSDIASSLESIRKQ